MKKRLLLSLVFFVSMLQVTWAQNTISGKVTSTEDNEPLPGVSIVVEGTNRGTTTDLDGNFTMQANSEDVLQLSYIGFLTQRITVGNQTTFNVTMEADLQQLEEVVVTAFGLEKEKKALGYSVTQVSGDQFTESRTINLGSALTGKVAGVNVSPPATGAAGSTRVLIRGGSSLGGSDQPLYVINGMPLDNSNRGAAGMWGGNDNGDGLSALNPDDIESVSVLKGATASALYGARAANGVILITTKSGSEGKMQVSFNSNFTLDRVNDLTDLQNQFGHGRNGTKPSNDLDALTTGQSSWGARLDGSNVLQFDGVERPYSDAGEGLNDFYRTGYTWTNTLGLSGGNQNMNYRISASDLTNEDIMPNAGYNRRMLNANTGGKFGKLEVKITAQYSKEEAENRPRLSDSPGNANSTVFQKSPAISFEDMKGSTGKLGAGEDGFELRHQNNIFSTNPYWAAYQFERFDVTDRILGNAQFKYNLTDWLYVQGRIGTDVLSSRNRRVEAYGTAYKPLGSVNETQITIREDNADLFVGFNKEFGQLGVDVLVGGNRQRRSFESTRIGGNDMIVPFLASVRNVGQQSYGYSFNETGINSVFGSATLSYNGYLFLNLTARQDWFSTLSADNNSILYPSVGLSYVLSEMVELPSAFTFVKLRGSWAQAGGGLGPGAYALQQTYGIGNSQHGSGGVLATIGNRGTIPNPDLQPYLTTEIEFGFDARFFNNRLGVDFAYYDRSTEDDLLSTSISSASGFGNSRINIGEINFSGVELMITGTPVQTRDFSWDVSFNIANNQTEVISLGTDAEGNPIEFLNLDESRTRQERIRHYIGQPLGLIAGYTHRTINGQKVYTAEGYPVRSEGFEILGEGRHPISGGISNNFRYKDFNLSFLIDFRSGGSLYSGTNVRLNGTGLHQNTLAGREDGITVSGVDLDGNPLTVNISAASGDNYLIDDYYSNYGRITDNFVYDAGFGKLRELSFGYSFPQSLLSGTPISSANLSIVGRNLMILWSDIPNVDPESAYTASGRAQGLEYFALPPVRNIGFNLSMTF